MVCGCFNVMGRDAHCYATERLCLQPPTLKLLMAYAVIEFDNVQSSVSMHKIFVIV